MSLYKNIPFLSGLKQRQRRVAPVFAGLLQRSLLALGRSLSVVEVGQERHETLLDRHAPLIYAFWHGHQLGLLVRHRHRTDLEVLVSQSEDGQLLFEVLRRFGLSTVRGSSSRGGAEAAEEMLHRLAAGRCVALTPDGPRGPRHSVAPGVVALARWSGRPIVPVALACRRAWQLRSWDGFLVPAPGSRIAIGYGAPLWIDAGADSKEAGEELARRLHALTAELAEAVRR
jgi:lysophospholipid acyltransferase (LPLAT)-like uncharacterized protein